MDTLARKAKYQKGFTLVEMMFCMVIVPLVFFSVYMVMEMANVIFRTNDVYSRLNQSTMQSLRSINLEVGQTSPNTSPSHLNISTSGGNSVVRFQIPVDWDNDGDADTGGLTPTAEWGAYDYFGQKTSGRLGAWARYSVSNNQLVRDVLDSSMNSISSLSDIVANNVQAFTVTQSQSTLTMTLTLQGTDSIGQKGGSRDLQTSFSSQTLLRNAVS